MKILLLYFLLFSCQAWSNSSGCSVEFFPINLYIGKKSHINLSHLIKKTDCPVSMQKTLEEIITQSKGKLKRDYIKGIFSIEHPNFMLNLAPSLLVFYPLKDFIKEKLGMPDDFIFKNLNLSTKKKVLNLNPEDSLEILTENTNLNTGQKTLPLRLRNEHFWAQVTLLMAKKVLVSKKFLGPSSKGLIRTDFLLETREVKNPEQYFNRPEHLKYYRLSRGLPKETPLKKTDLVKLDLIQFNRPVKILYNRKGISLQSWATPLQSGKLEDIIRLSLPKKKDKIILGKVIDFNLVEVGL